MNFVACLRAPVTVEAHAVSGKLFWDDGVGAAGAGEPRGFAETSEFNRALFRALDLIDTVRYPGFSDKGLVRRVEENHRVVF